MSPTLVTARKLAVIGCFGAPGFTIDPTTGCMVLPPNEILRKMTRDEKADFTRRESMISHRLVVGKVCHY